MAKMCIYAGSDDMKKIKITTPENIEVEYILADLASRTAAAMVDMMILGIITLIIAIADLLILYFSPTLWEKHYGWIIGITLIIFAIIYYGYFVVMEITMNGQTLGKKIMKLRTIRSNGQPITIIHSAIRNFFRLFLDNFGIGVVLIFFTKEKRRIGDFAASTIVVADEEKTTPITLESLQKTNQHYSYYISNEENELLREYFERKNKMADYRELQYELKKHFTKKFKDLGLLDEWKSFIDEI